MKPKVLKKKLFQRVVSLFTTLALCTTMNFTAMAAQAKSSADKYVTIDILSLNDLHGAVDKDSKTNAAGIAEIVTEIKNYQSKNKNTYVVSAGDNFEGTAPSNITYGKPVMDFFNTIGLKYSAIGNHDYDWGVSQINNWEKGGLQFLACNISMKDGGNLPGYVKPYDIVSIGGVQVAFVGLATPQTAYSTISKNVKDIQFNDPVASAKEYVAKARADGAQVVLLLSHIGTYQNGSEEPTFETYPNGTNAAGLVDSGADAIITGHSHNEVCGTITNSEGKEIPVVQAGKSGKDLADLSIVYDSKTNTIVSITPSLDKMYTKSIKSDRAMEKILAKDEKQSTQIMNKQLGENDIPLVRNNYTLSNLGQWTCNAMLNSDQNNGTPADIAVENAHVFYADLPAKSITMGDIYQVMPFDDFLINIKLKGADIKSLFTYGLNDAIGNGLGQLQFSGCKVTWHKDPSNKILDVNTNKPVLDENGKPIHVRVIDKIVLNNGEVVTDEGVYTIATNGFMLLGGDNYTMLSKGRILNVVGGLRDIVADYFQSLAPLSFVSQNLSVPVTNTKRTKTVVISDIHLGADNRFDETQRNKPALVKFLQQIENSKDVAELCIAGDLFDQWVMPMNYVLPASLSQYNDMIVKNNQDVIDIINDIIKQGKISVTYIPGNHDMLFDAGEVSRIFPGINQARDVEGLGTYRPTSQIAIEHGHRYNIYCAPDSLSNTDLTGGSSILPSGYFYTRIGTSSFLEGMPKTTNVVPPITSLLTDITQLGYYEYHAFWKSSLTGFPIIEPFSEAVINMGIDGYTQPVTVSDLIPYSGTDGKIHVNLYDKSIENWPKREAMNNVPVPVNTDVALEGGGLDSFTDDQAQTQYFNRDGNVKVVIFGHTHVAKLISEKNLNGQDVIYANSGTWIDNTHNFPSCTYVTIDNDTASSQITVSVNQFHADGTSTVLSTDQISSK